MAVRRGHREAPLFAAAADARARLGDGGVVAEQRGPGWWITLRVPVSDLDPQVVKGWGLRRPTGASRDTAIVVEDGEAAVAEVACGRGGTARHVCVALVRDQSGQKHV